MSFSETLCPGIPPRSYPPCPASITTVVGDPSPELLPLFAACELAAKNVTNRPAANETTRQKFLRIISRLSARWVAGLRVLVLWYSSSRAFPSSRHAQLPRHHRNGRGGAGFLFP